MNFCLQSRITNIMTVWIFDFMFAILNFDIICTYEYVSPRKKISLVIILISITINNL